jgi:hypothetical protein
MTIGICPINKIYSAGTIPHGKTYLAGQNPEVGGSEMDFSLFFYFAPYFVYQSFLSLVVHNLTSMNFQLNF